MKKRLRRLESGQSLVEFALGGIAIVFLLSGMLDLGRLYFTYIALEDSAGEAALFLSLYPTCLEDSGGVCAGTNNAVYRASRATGGHLNFDVSNGSTNPSPPGHAYLSISEWESPTTKVTVQRPQYYGAGDTVRVEMTYQFHLLTPLISQIVGGGTLPLTSSASQTIVSE